MEIILVKIIATFVIGILAYCFAKLRMKQDPRDNYAGRCILGWSMFVILSIWLFGN